jgi:hypothetical protein
MIFFASNNLFLHKVDKIYVNISDRCVYVTDKKLRIKLFPSNYFKKLNFNWLCFRVEKNTVDNFKKILEKNGI